MIRLPLFLVLVSILSASGLAAQAVKVEVRADGPGYQLYREGAPYYIKGAGGSHRLDLLAAAGGNSVRTWGEDQIESVIGEAHKNGLTLLAGLWLTQERQGMDYKNPVAVAAEIERHKATVLRYKDDPAILMWAVGNELEIHDADPAVWDAVEQLAAWIKQVDPHHPVMTVTAFPDEAVLHAIRARAPSVDVLGVNAYAALPVLAPRLAKAWPGPVVVTEWGPNGQWEAPKTPWGAVIEPTSTEKAQQFAQRYKAISGNPRCLGSYAFVWGHKIEATLTWFGLFLEDGSPLGGVDALQQGWTGKWPENRAPDIEPIHLNGKSPIKGVSIEPGTRLEAVAPVSDAKATVKWALMHDEHRPPLGGDPEPRPQEVETAFSTQGGAVTFTAPMQPGMYRLYAFAKSASGKAATANIPFLVKGQAMTLRSTVTETSRHGGYAQAADNLRPVTGDAPERVFQIIPEQRFQEIQGIGGAFTESSAYVLQQMTPGARQAVLDAYFSPEGAAFSLMRTHVGGCDFSLGSYNYAPVPGDVKLEHFSVKEDEDDLIPLIKDAQAVSRDGFRILSSPWTAPSWMKDNGHPFAGHLLPEHYATFANYYARYIQAYAQHGIKIWAITPLNEPEGNGGQWDSMHMTPEEMATLVGQHIGPVFEREGIDAKIFTFDQNRSSALDWAHRYFRDPEAAKYTVGTAVHWYSSTVDYYPEVIRTLLDEQPGKMVMHTEGCIDAINGVEPMAWMEPDWYWRRECTDWGYRWAPPQDRHDHPRYAPFYRYARDLLGGLQSGMSGWIDWNIVLDFNGGPNHVKNWCLAPVLCDPETDTVFKTPLYYAMWHFSHSIRPGAVRIGCPEMVLGLMGGAFQNPDGSIVVVLLNEEPTPMDYALQLRGKTLAGRIPGEALQTIVLH